MYAYCMVSSLISDTLEFWAEDMNSQGQQKGSDGQFYFCKIVEE